ncbi:hypothetical protein GOV12_02480 [Candidatus Pacearchaeota archaeon]|nr:hypothetical protein [Candidatus Pacearchaeota archaeon]
MGHRIEVMMKGSVDSDSRGLVTGQPIRGFNIDDDTLTVDELKTISDIVADPIVDLLSINSPVLPYLPENGIVIEQSPKPGVTDPEGEQTRKVISRTLSREIGPVSSSRQHLFVGELDDRQYVMLTKQIGNPLINDFMRVNSEDWDFSRGVGYHFPKVDLPSVPAFEHIDLGVDDNGLMKISNDRYLSLNLEEMKTIRELFRDREFLLKREEAGLGNMSTDADIESLAQTWSEHCCHKKLNAKWIYTSDDPNDQSGLPNVTDSVFKSIIRESTERIQKEGDIDWMVSVYCDNAGVVRLNEDHIIAHKVETHNHPSALDGYGGANTGTGGVIRDPKTTGKNMIIRTSQFAFRTPHPKSYPDLPIDIQSPARTLETVVMGVEDYGNKFGVSTMCGNVFIDDGWSKCAIYVGGVATAKAKINGRYSHVKEIKPGMVAYSLGGRVGKDGIHGATGSSTGLSAEAEQSDQINQSVQFGSPITEKGVFEVMNILADLDIIEASQDCGAGGWNSAVGELVSLLNDMEKTRYDVQTLYEQRGITQSNGDEERINVASEIVDFNDRIYNPFLHTLEDEIVSGEIFEKRSGRGGAVMDLSNVLEKYLGLTGWEKQVSEAQERNVLVVKVDNEEWLKEICCHNNVEATKIAVFNDSGYFEVKDQDQTISFLPTEFLHRGLPQMTINAHWTPCDNEEPKIPINENLTFTLLEMMRRPNMQSYEWIRTRFDHEVQGGSLIKPIVGKGRVDSDAVAYHPELTEKEVVIETLGSNPWQGDIDSYEMGKNNVVDAIGKSIAAGGNLERIVFNGNTTCPKPENDSYIAAQVIRMLKGSADAEIAFGTPRISGKDSTSMERSYISTETGKEVRVKAKPELLMSGLTIIEDDSTITTCDFKKEGDNIYVVGDTRDELGASEFYNMHGETGRNVPKSDLLELKKRFEVVSDAIKMGYVNSAQYVSKGGLAAAISKSSIGGDIGVSIDISELDEGLERADKILFSETTGRFLLSIRQGLEEKFEGFMRERGEYFGRIGKVNDNYDDKEFKINYEGRNVIGSYVGVLKISNRGGIEF